MAGNIPPECGSKRRTQNPGNPGPILRSRLKVQGFIIFEHLDIGPGAASELAAAGVGWVVVESGRGSMPLAPLALPVAYHDDQLTLYRVGGDHPAAAQRHVMIAAHLGWLGTLAVGACGTLVGAIRSRRRPRAPGTPSSLGASGY